MKQGRLYEDMRNIEEFDDCIFKLFFPLLYSMFHLFLDVLYVVWIRNKYSVSVEYCHYTIVTATGHYGLTT